jgi:hypothetical protein
MLSNYETSSMTASHAGLTVPVTARADKTCVILQPSYIPWRGYFDQILKADIFVFYDDVQYDKHGWRNRNRIKTSHGSQWLTIPVASKGNITQSRNIKDIPIVYDKDWINQHLENLKSSYSRTPFYREYMDLLLPFYKKRYELLADFTIDTTIALAGKLGVGKERFVRSSELGIEADRNQRLIDILRHLKCEHYITGPSAQDYIERQLYADAGIRLSFINYDYPEYPQLHPPFDPQVTILDLLFMMGGESLKYMTGSLTS